MNFVHSVPIVDVHETAPAERVAAGGGNLEFLGLFQTDSTLSFAEERVNLGRILWEWIVVAPDNANIEGNGLPVVDYDK